LIRITCGRGGNEELKPEISSLPVATGICNKCVDHYGAFSICIVGTESTRMSESSFSFGWIEALTLANTIYKRKDIGS